MTPGRLYLLAILCLVLAGFLLFGGPATGLRSILGTAAILLAIVTYLLGLYMNRLGRRGEEALDALRSRIASVTEEAIRSEHRVYHLGGLPELAAGGLMVLYETVSGWLLVPLLEELAWVKVPREGVGEVKLESAPEGLILHVAMRSDEGTDMDLRLASTQVEAKIAAPADARDLAALQAALTGGTTE